MKAEVLQRMLQDLWVGPYCPVFILEGENWRLSLPFLSSLYIVLTQMDENRNLVIKSCWTSSRHETNLPFSDLPWKLTLRCLRGEQSQLTRPWHAQCCACQGASSTPWARSSLILLCPYPPNPAPAPSATTHSLDCDYNALQSPPPLSFLPHQTGNLV